MARRYRARGALILDVIKLSNAQIATEMLAAYQRGDREALAALADPKIEVHGEPGLLNAGDYSGMDGFFHWTAAWEEAWDDPSYEIASMSEIGDDCVIAAVRVKGTGANSGLPMKDVYGWLWQIRDGRVVRFHTYIEHETAVQRARELAGLEPDSTEQREDGPPEPPAWEQG